MRADLELLGDSDTGYKPPPGPAPKSNLPPFDIKVPEGQDPDELAREIALGGFKKRRADLELFDPSTPRVPVEEYKPKSTGPAINVEAYDPIALFGKLVPKAPPPKPKLELPFEGVTSLSRSDDKPNFIERGIDFLSGLFGADNIRGLSEGAKAQALVTHMAREEGVPLDQYRQSPEFVEKAASSFISMSTLGLAPVLKESLTGEVDYPATDTPGYVGQALGSLAGLYTAPIMIAGKLVRPVVNFLPKAFQNEAVAVRMFKSALRDSVLLGPAIGLSVTGEALEQVTFTQAADKIWEGTKSGAMIGTIFGASRGMFPKDGVQTGARIFTGLVGLNAYRAVEVGGNPFTNRPMGDVLFDIALDTFFLYKGLPKNMRFEVAQDLTNLNTKIDKAKTPPAPAEGEQIPPEVLQQAQVKVAAVEQIQIELAAKAIEAKAKVAIEAKAELEVKGQEVKDIKEGKEPKVEIESEELDPDLRAMMEADDAAPTGPKRADLELIEPKPKAKAKVKKAKVPEKVKEPITDLDLQTGTAEPEGLKQDNHPFRDADKKHTNEVRTLMQEKINKMDASPEVFTRYLINEANRYLNGEEVPIDKVRLGLSELATRADNLETKFDRKVDFDAWRDTVKEAAKWARNSDRLINKRTGGTQLNMMIPVNELPEFVVDVMKKIKVVVGGAIQSGKLYRNKEIFDKTGYWAGKDGKWRYEIGDEGLKVSPTLIKDEGFTLPLNRVIEHPTLYNAVPELKDTNIKLNRELKTGGVYHPDTHTIEIKYPDKDIVVHEVQHVVNEIMGSRFRGSSVEGEKIKINSAFADSLTNIAKSKEVLDQIEKLKKIGYNIRSKLAMESIIRQSEDPMEKVKLKDLMDEFVSQTARENYMKDPGEMESRLSEQRRGMTPEQRKAEPPWETLDDMLYKEGAQDVTDTPNDLYKRFVPTAGLKLYSGIDPTEATKKIIEGAKALARYTANARGMKAFKPGEAAERTKEELTRSFVDRSGNIRRELLDQLGNDGYEIIQKMYLSKGASSLAAQQLKQMRGEVYDGLSKNEKRVLDNLILADRMLDLGKYKTTKQFAYPEGLTPVEAASYKELFQYTEGLSAERAEVLQQRAGAYFDWMKKPLKDMLDAELIDQAEYDALSSHNYRRLKLVDVFDKRYQSKMGKRTRTVYDSGVESLAHGRDTDIFEPSSEVMALEVFNRAYGRILNNSANKTLLDLARTQPDNPFVAVKEKPTDKIPSGWDRIFVYEKGERKALYLSPEMAKEWITNNPEMSYKLSQFLRYASGSPVLRTFATGIDWGFALANLPRDIMHTWFTARVFKNGKWESVYSPNLPMFGLQMGRDQAAIFGDALLRKGRYEDYIREGGGMEFLVHQGRLLQRGRHIEGGVDKVQDLLGYFGETTEIMTRLAIRERVIRNKANEQGITFEEALKDKKITQEATFAARDYMDFGQGGGIAKALDNGIPYLNAAIQGTRGMFRAFRPGSGTALISTYKLAQLGALVTGLYIANRKLNPETMRALQGNIDMQNNLVLPLGDGFSFLDEKGQTRYPYLKIPIDPGQKFFKTFFEASTDKWLGNPVDVEAVTNSLSQLSPVGISSLPPTVSATLGYITNKDFWLNEDIWKKTDKPLGWPQSKEEYIPGQTPQAAIDFGAATGLSPERSKFAVEQLVTGGSMWSWLAGQGYEALLGDLPKDKKEMHLAEALSKIPVIKRFVGITNPYSQYAQPVAEAREGSSLTRWIENRGLDTVVENYLYKEGTSREDVTKYIRDTAVKAEDKDTYDRLRDRFKFQENIKGLANRSFWLALKGTPDTEARARLFVQRFDAAGEAEKEQIRSEIGIVQQAGGVISDEFKREVGKLRSR